MSVLGWLGRARISWSTGGRQRFNGELLDALAKVLKAEAQLRSAAGRGSGAADEEKNLQAAGHAD
eukprot:1800819-Pleurochrysis_carterae.AAC.1